MAQSIYIYGPAGCGKTTNSEKLRKYFKQGRVVDDYNSGATLVTDYGDLVLGIGAANGPKGIRRMSYWEAARAAGIPLKEKL